MIISDSNEIEKSHNPLRLHFTDDPLIVNLSSQYNLLKILQLPNQVETEMKINQFLNFLSTAPFHGLFQFSPITRTRTQSGMSSGKQEKNSKNKSR